MLDYSHGFFPWRLFYFRLWRLLQPIPTFAMTKYAQTPQFTSTPFAQTPSPKHKYNCKTLSEMHFRRMCIPTLKVILDLFRNSKHTCTRIKCVPISSITLRTFTQTLGRHVFVIFISHDSFQRDWFWSNFKLPLYKGNQQFINLLRKISF